MRRPSSGAGRGGRGRRTITRRAFLVTGITLAGGVAVGLAYLSRAGTGIPERFRSGGGEGAVALNAWLRIEPDGTVALALPRAEMGQGVGTALAMLAAEELRFPLERMTLEDPGVHGAYTNYALVLEEAGLFRREGHPVRWLLSKVVASVPVIATGGSTSVMDAWMPLRQAGAAAREMLVAAAAARWGVEPKRCRAAAGEVLHPDGRARLPYHELAAEAARIEPPAEPPLRPPDAFRVVGRPAPRLDLPDKVTGRAVFGVDVREPGMLHATVVHVPVKGGRIRGFDAAAVERMRGVVGVHPVSGGVGIVADNTWRAFQAAKALRLTVDDGGNAALSSAALEAALDAALDGDPSHVFEEAGDAARARARAPVQVEAEYLVPYLAHACMEPMNATVRVSEQGLVDVRAPVQSPTIAQWAAAEGAGVERDRVRVHVTLLGGGFGRRAERDFVLQAAELARHHPGRAVQLTWSREEDIRNDAYRPMARARLSAGLDGAGGVQGWEVHLASQSVEYEFGERTLPLGGFGGERAFMNAAGAFRQPYALGGDRLVAHHWQRAPVPVGFWRSVGHSQNAFFVESFIDELAHAAGTDPVDFRRRLLAGSPRHRAVLEAVAELAGWEGGGDRAQGRGRGVALHESFGSIVAQIAQVSVQDGRLRVERVWVAADTGVVVNPDTLEAQLQSGVVYGLTAALHGEITLEGGRIVQSNFPDYEMVRLADAPRIEVRLVPSGDFPGGAGEIGTPPIAPAVANAVFAATGRRLRRLPLRLQG